MGQAFRLGGWGMYPTTVVGIVLLFSAIQYARAPRNIQLVKHLSLLTALVATLGFTTGVIRCFTNVGAADPGDFNKIVVTGVGESLNNLGLGIGMLVLAWATASIGTYRKGSPGPAELHGASMRP